MSLIQDNQFITNSEAETPPETYSKPIKGRGAFNMAPPADSESYFRECHGENMIYSGAYHVGIYTRTGICSNTKPKVRNPHQKRKITNVFASMLYSTG